MKKILLFLPAICLIMASCAGTKSVSSTATPSTPTKSTEKQTTATELQKLSPTEEKLVGLWRGEDQGDVGYINFDPDGYAFFLIGGDTLGGRSFDLEGREASMTYNVNEKDTPKSIDFKIQVKDLDRTVRQFPGIIKFTEGGNLMLCLSFGGGEARPTSFIEKDTITLTRVSKKE